MTVAPPAASPRAPAGEIGLNPGETMAFEVQVAGLVAGEAQLAVGELGDYQGRRAVVVKSHGETAGAAALIKHVVDEATTVIDMETGLPLSIETMVVDGDTVTKATATVTGGVADIAYRRSDEPAPHRVRVGSPKVAIHDAHSAMAQLRGWRAAQGGARTVFIIGGRRLWRVDVKLVGEDTVGGKIGNRHAVVFSGQAYRVNRNLEAESPTPSRTFKVWLSDDADRVPLKLTAATELGNLELELTDYTR